MSYVIIASYQSMVESHGAVVQQEIVCDSKNRIAKIAEPAMRGWLLHLYTYDINGNVSATVSYATATKSYGTMTKFEYHRLDNQTTAVVALPYNVVPMSEIIVPVFGFDAHRGPTLYITANPDEKPSWTFDGVNGSSNIQTSPRLAVAHFIIPTTYTRDHTVKAYSKNLGHSHASGQQFVNSIGQVIDNLVAAGRTPIDIDQIPQFRVAQFSGLPSPFKKPFVGRLGFEPR